MRQCVAAKRFTQLTMVFECYKLFKKIQPRPAIWTGENSLKSIYLYASGYYAALLDQNVYSAKHTDEPFFDWVAEKLGYYESTAGWVNMIVAYSLGFEPSEINWEKLEEHPITQEEHNDSIARFYELLEEYKSEMNRV